RHDGDPRPGARAQRRRDAGLRAPALRAEAAGRGSSKPRPGDLLDVEDRRPTRIAAVRPDPRRRPFVSGTPPRGGELSLELRTTTENPRGERNGHASDRQCDRVATWST